MIKKIFSLVAAVVLAFSFADAAVQPKPAGKGPRPKTIKNVSKAGLVKNDTVDLVSWQMKELNPQDTMLPEKRLPEPRFVSMGVVAGLNVSSYNTNMEGTGMVFGPQVGLTMEFPIGQYFAIAPEFLLSMKGGQYDYCSNLRKTENNSKETLLYVKEPKETLLYMDIPINLKFSARMRKGRPFISVAPTLCFGLYGKTKFTRTNESDIKLPVFQADSEMDQEESYYDAFDFAFNFRLGYDMYNNWSVYAGYQMGLRDIMNVSAKDMSYINKNGLTVPEVKNRNFFIALGYRW